MPYYLCRMVGAGTEDDPYKPFAATVDESVSWVMVGEVGKGCLVFMPNPSRVVDANQGIKKINKGLAERFDDTGWADLKNALKAHGLNSDEIPSPGQKTAKDVLEWIGRKYTGWQGFTLENLYVS